MLITIPSCRSRYQLIFGRAANLWRRTSFGCQRLFWRPTFFGRQTLLAVKNFLDTPKTPPPGRSERDEKQVSQDSCPGSPPRALQEPPKSPRPPLLWPSKNLMRCPIPLLGDVPNGTKNRYLKIAAPGALQEPSKNPPRALNPPFLGNQKHFCDAQNPSRERPKRNKRQVS